MSVKQIPFENIDPNPWQTRLVEDPDHIAALVDSIKQGGLLQIPTARPLTGDRYQLAFGDSRLLAGLAQATGLDLPKDWAERAAAYEPKFDDQDGSDAR